MQNEVSTLEIKLYKLLFNENLFVKNNLFQQNQCGDLIKINKWSVAKHVDSANTSPKIPLAQHKRRHDTKSDKASPPKAWRFDCAAWKCTTNLPLFAEHN